MSSIDEDEALIAAALKGSAFAWEKLVRRYESKIYNHGLRLLGNRTDAMDLMQEVFLGVYRNLSRFRGDARFSSWLFRIAHNKAVDLNRKQRLLAGYPISGDEADPFDSIPDEESIEPDTRLLEHEKNAQIMNMVANLPFDQRLIVELKVFQSLTFEEIAAMQEISDNTAKTRFYTALRKLKGAMEEQHALSQDTASLTRISRG